MPGPNDGGDNDPNWGRYACIGLQMHVAVGLGIVVLAPLMLAGGASQAFVSQAALVGTMIHLMGCLAGAAVMLMVVRMPAATYWILAFYWATLVALVVAFTRAIKAAPAQAAPKP